LQLILPCLDDVTVLASIGGERISLTPDARTVSEIHPDLTLSLWNGLFVHKDTPADAREKISAAARKALQSEQAMNLPGETGVLIYWQDPEASMAQIESDKQAFGVIAGLLGE